MELSIQINSRLRKAVPSKEKIVQLTPKISCQAAKGTFAMQNQKAKKFYELLSLDCSKNVGFDEIKKAYRCKALRYHPDACSPLMKEESTRRFIEIRMAYETLSDPISREIYDHELSLFGAEGRRRLYGRYNKDGLEEFPREVWERQLRELKNRSRQKLEKRIDKKK